jgi:hypothetical protein
MCIPGQPPVSQDELAPVLDDAVHEWSTLIHEARLQLVRMLGALLKFVLPKKPFNKARLRVLGAQPEAPLSPFHGTWLLGTLHLDTLH